MKFAFLIQEPGLGGLASMHDRLQKALEEEGHEVDKLIVQKEGVISKVTEGDYDVAHLFFTPFLNIKFFFKLLRFNTLSDTRVFVNYYNIKPENFFRRTMKRIFLPLLCDTVVLPSKNMEKFYQQNIGISNTATLRPIVEDKFFEIESRGDNIIYFGHSRPDKGIDRIIELASDDYPIHCYFIQDKEHVFNQYPEMKEKIEEEKIIWRDELPAKALSNAKVALFPFHNLKKTVDLPLALIESLAAGVPVLTSDLSPLNQHLPEDFLIKEWNDQEVGERIEKLAQDNCKCLAREIARNMKLDKISVVDHYLEIIPE